MINFIKITLIISLSLLALPLLAQFPPPPASAAAAGPGVPIDGGVIAIVSAGVAYGLNKYRKRRKTDFRS